MKSSLTLLSQRLISLRMGGLALLTLLLLIAVWLELPLAYPNLFMIAAEWLVLHGVSVLSQRKWDLTVNSLLLQMLADIAIIASLLAFSGGVHNPFFALLLLPLLLSVGILPLTAQYLLLTGILTSATLLALVPAPVNASIPTLPNTLYALLFALDGGIIRATPFNPLDVLAKLGLWLNLLLIATITAFFLSRLHQKLQEQQQTIKDAELSSMTQQHLLSLGLKAAATAHELSTPLATMSLLASEAKDAYRQGDLKDAEQALSDIQHLIMRCKTQISDSLALSALERSDRLRQQSWTSYLQQLLSHWHALRPTAVVSFTPPNTPTPPMLDLPQLTQVITTLLNNAADANNASANMTLDWNDQEISLCIHNMGAGFTEEQLSRFPQPQISDKADGHGVGLSLAYAAITQLGGTLVINNPSSGGAQVCIHLPTNLANWHVD